MSDPDHLFVDGHVAVTILELGSGPDQTSVREAANFREETIFER